MTSKTDPRHGLPLRERVRLTKLMEQARRPNLSTEDDHVIYLRQAAGSDDQDGRDDEHAVATLSRALELAGLAEGRRVVIEVTGEVLTGAQVLQLGSLQLGGIDYALDGAAESVSRVSRQYRQLRAELSLVRAVTVTAQAEATDSELVELTVSETLVPGAHRGQIVKSDVIGEWGAIRDNTEDTIYVDKLGEFTDVESIAIFTRGAVVRFGPGDFFNQCAYLNALSGWSISGIDFETLGSEAAALTIWPNAPVELSFCSFEGLHLHGGSGTVTLDACYVHSKTFAHDGSPLRVFATAFRDVSFACHGSGDGGLNEWIGFSIDDSNALGSGNAESRYSIQAENFHIAGSSADGVRLLFGRSSLTNGVIENCADSAIYVGDTASVSVSNVSGEGTTARYGIECPAGPARVRALAGTTVTGALDDLLIGTTELTYAGLPSTDAVELVVAVAT